MILGTPIREREGAWDKAIDELDPLLVGVVELIRSKLGPSEAVDQAANEWMNITRLGNSMFELQSRRAALLYAFYREESVRKHFQKTDPEFVEDLQNILSLFVPVHYSNFFQSPHALVISVSVTSGMWDLKDLRAALAPETLPPE